MTAHDFVLAYHNIQVPEFDPSTPHPLFGTRMVPAPVREYLNLDIDRDIAAKPGKSSRLGFKNQLLDFFEGIAKQKNSGITYDGEFFHLNCSVAPVQNFKRKWFMSCFGGKASPKGMASMAQLISYWRCWMIHKKGRTDLRTLQEMVFRNLGVDCNGFVGSYIRTKFPATGVFASTPSAEYDRIANVRRKKPSELRADDIIVFNKRHIAVISSVRAANDAEALVEVSEARNPDQRDGGAQTAVFTIRVDSKKEWAMSPSRDKTVRSIVRIPGMD